MDMLKRSKVLESKIEALKLTEDLWYWLKEHPQKGKTDWPNWDDYGYMPNHCPCCAYSFAKENASSTCRYCPLKGQWSQRFREGRVECEWDDAPYRLWIESDHDPKYARRIYLLAFMERRRLEDAEEKMKSLEASKSKFQPISFEIRTEEEAFAFWHVLNCGTGRTLIDYCDRLPKGEGKAVLSRTFSFWNRFDDQYNPRSRKD